MQRHELYKQHQKYIQTCSVPPHIQLIQKSIVKKKGFGLIAEVTYSNIGQRFTKGCEFINFQNFAKLPIPIT